MYHPFKKKGGVLIAHAQAVLYKGCTNVIQFSHKWLRSTQAVYNLNTNKTLTNTGQKGPEINQVLFDSLLDVRPKDGVEVGFRKNSLIVLLELL